jgi:hypothetical protein
VFFLVHVFFPTQCVFGVRAFFRVPVFFRILLQVAAPLIGRCNPADVTAVRVRRSGFLHRAPLRFEFRSRTLGAGAAADPCGAEGCCLASYCVGLRAFFGVAAPL